MPASPDPRVLVSAASVASDDLYDIIQSNIDVVNALREGLLLTEEIAPDAMRSYYADYFKAQIDNGGFSQLVYNTRWNPQTVRWMREGLAAMGATEHLAFLDRLATRVDALGAEARERFLNSGYFGDAADVPERDPLDEDIDEYMEIEEDLIALNATWLRSRSGLLVLDEDALQAEIEKRIAAIPDLAEREAAALAAEPRYMKLVRALCEHAGYELERVTGGDPSYEHGGVPTIAWHFLTDHGHHYMVDLGDRAIVFDGKSKKALFELPTAPLDLPPS